MEVKIIKVKNFIERLREFDPEANIYFTIDPNSKEGYATMEIVEHGPFQLEGIIKK